MSLSQEEITLLKRGLVGLSNEITQWLPGKKTWFFMKRQNKYAEDGHRVLRNIEELLLKLDVLSLEPNEIIESLVIDVEQLVAEGTLK